MFSENIFTEEEIHKNLSFDEPISFISEKVNPEGTPDYPERIPFTSQLWYKYCAAQRESFTRRFKTKCSSKRKKKEVNENISE